MACVCIYVHVHMHAHMYAEEGSYMHLRACLPRLGVLLYHPLPYSPETGPPPEPGDVFQPGWQPAGPKDSPPSTRSTSGARVPGTYGHAWLLYGC